MAPFDETGVTLFVPFAAGATAGLLVLLLVFSELGCTAGATACAKIEFKFSNSFTII